MGSSDKLNLSEENMSEKANDDAKKVVPSGRVLRQRIDNGDVLWGFYLTLPAPEIVELVKDYDWIWVDGQHGQLSYETILDCVRVGDVVDVPTIVRTPGHDYSQIGPVLDTGASGVMVPMIHNAEQGRAVASAAKFAPLGHRSFGGRRVVDRFGGGYAASANEDTILLGQIESIEGLANVEEIAAVPGIDGLMFGPVDYALECGLDAKSALNLSEPAVWEAARKIGESCSKYGKVACTIINSVETAVRLVGEGYQMLNISMDAAMLGSGASERLNDFRQGLQAV